MYFLPKELNVNGLVRNAVGGRSSFTFQRRRRTPFFGELGKMLGPLAKSCGVVTPSNSGPV